MDKLEYLKLNSDIKIDEQSSLYYPPYFCLLVGYL